MDELTALKHYQNVVMMAECFKLAIAVLIESKDVFGSQVLD